MDPALATSVSNFAVRFYNELPQGNSAVCSPLSAQMVLALLALGCAGPSRDELLHAMDLRDDDAIRSSFAFLTSTLKTFEGVALRTANRVYLKNNGTLKPAIKKDAEEAFDSGLEQMDFMKSRAAAARINRWVEKQTANMIKNLIDADALGMETELVLVNAIYFQGYWETKFSKKLTKERTFYVDNSTEILVPMMLQKNNFYHYKHSPELKAKLLRMDYQNRQASMVIVLPDEVEGLSDVMQQLAAGHNLNVEIAGLQRMRIDVMIPKFKVETRIDLIDLLPKMGVQSIFGKNTSDIRMLTSNERQYVSEAVQKAVIEVDEAGTKAAAATAFVMSIPRMAGWHRPQNPKFEADRPFLYLLMAGQIPLFIGVYQGSEFAVPATSPSSAS